MISTPAACRRLPLILVPIAAASTQIGHAQQALRNAIEVDRVAEAQTTFGQGRNTFGQDVNVLQWGPARFTVGVSYSLEYDDNVYLDETDPQSDFINTPALNLGMAVPLSARSMLTLRVGLGYEIYVENSELSRFYLTPNSDLYWSIPIGRDLTLSFYDRFSYSTDPVSEPSVSRTGELERFENTIGTVLSWQPDRYLFSVGYSHLNYITGDSTSSGGISRDRSYLDRSSDQLFARAGYRFTEATQGGMEGTADFTRYDEPLRDDFNAYSVGPYVTWQVLETLAIDVRGGLSFYDFQERTSGISRETFTSYYAALDARHQLTEHISHNLSFVTGIQPSFESELSQLSQRISVAYGPSWQFHHAASLTASLSYERGDESTVGIGEEYSRFGFGIGVGVNLTARWNTGLRYQFYTRDSNVRDRDYQQNSVVLYTAYAF
jgi:hypothetical protein